jgi:lipopolysaccharide transport system permease protein
MSPTAFRIFPATWKSLSRYLVLALYESSADLRAESRRTYIGYLWWIVDPLASMLVYYLVFEVVFDRGIENYAIFLFVALVPWRWFQTTLVSGASSILHARGVMLQVYLPKAIFPFVTFLTNTAKFMIVFALLVIVLPFFGFPVGAPHLALPGLLVIHGLFATGCTFIASALTPFFPDLRMVLQNIVRLWFFLSGIFYAVSDLPPRLESWFRLNPLTAVMESYREILMYGRWPDAAALTATAVVAVALNLLGLGILGRYDYVYPRLSP